MEHLGTERLGPEHDRYPNIYFEEAERIVDLLGWEDDLFAAMAASCIPFDQDNPSQHAMNLYIYHLACLFFNTFEEQWQGATWVDCPAEARNFFHRITLVERWEVEI